MNWKLVLNLSMVLGKQRKNEPHRILEVHINHFYLSFSTSFQKKQRYYAHEN